jgi:hypothetical protein
MLASTDRINNFREEREAIELRLVNRFDTGLVPVQYSNTNFLKRGTETIPTPYKGEAFIRLNILGNTSTRPEITRKINQMNSSIDFNIFTRQDQGSNRAREIADQLFDIFNATEFNGIITGAATLRELPPNNGWYNMNLNIPFRWYRCISG